MNYTNDDILSELFNVFGITMDDVDKIKKEFSELEKKKPEVKKTDFKKDKPTPTVNYVPPTSESNTCNHCDNIKTPKCDVSNEIHNEPKQVAKDVYTVDDVYFELLNHAENVILGENATVFKFEECVDGLCFPGITNKQLLWVLYVRYMKDPKKFDLIKQLLATEL